MGTPAQLEVSLKDGRQFFRENNHVIGSPAHPLTMEQFKALFIKFTRDVLPDAELRWTVDALARLEELDQCEVAKLMHILVHKKEPGR